MSHCPSRTDSPSCHFISSHLAIPFPLRLRGLPLISSQQQGPLTDRRLLKPHHAPHTPPNPALALPLLCSALPMSPLPRRGSIAQPAFSLQCPHSHGASSHPLWLDLSLEHWATFCPAWCHGSSLGGLLLMVSILGRQRSLIATSLVLPPGLSQAKNAFPHKNDGFLPCP